MNPKQPFDRITIIKDILPNEIPEPGSRFVQFLDQLKGVPSLNRFTIPDFTAQVRNRYANTSSPKPTDRGTGQTNEIPVTAV